LLHGDLWTANVLLDDSATEPEVVGVVDSERSWWGDPLADWALYRADARASSAEREAFWDGYGGRPSDPDSEWRLLLYRGRHLVAERVEAARLGLRDRVAGTVTELARVLAALG
jgi:aminoglycoside phosphotransferase (APT) family kinase protein